MSLRFQSEIDALKREGITLNDLTGDEVEKLVDAVQRVRNPWTEVNADALQHPLFDRDGVTLYPLTIGAVVWLEEYARRWFSSRPKTYFWAVMFALIHSREQGVFDRLRTEADAYEAIKEQGLKISLCEDELTEAIDTALNFNRPSKRHDNAPQSDETGVDWERIIITLEVSSGIPAEKWIWGRSADYAVRAYNTLNERLAKMSGKSVARLKDELDHAMNNLAAVRAEIVERVKKERGEADEQDS